VIREVLNVFGGLVVVDEAYVDFADRSMMAELDAYPNLIILQTFSKAWGLAGSRLGMAFASKEIIAILDKVKPPYNVSEETQRIALEALKNAATKEGFVQELNSLRAQLATELRQVPGVIKVFPSQANFLLVQMENAEATYHSLLGKGIVTRNRSNVKGCENCLRITVGTEVENTRLLNALNGSESRLAIHTRITNETKVAVELNLEGNGVARIHTGLRFFDHMLEQIARHGRVDLAVRTIGDLDIDEHHTIEDTAITLGEAFAKAVGNKLGMERYGFALPMDDAEATVLIDFGGRSWLVWDVELKREKIGDVPAEMFFHFFKSFSDAAKCNLNIKAGGDNEHHKIEAVFKAFAKAIRMAVKKDPFSNYLPSTKGIL
jgi:imidazoleglycerol phosphate dehydratase HisB